VLQGFLIAVNDFTTKVRVEIGWIAEYFKETADSFLSLVLGLLLHVN
jgi:hypothetical protein